MHLSDPCQHMTGSQECGCLLLPVTCACLLFMCCCCSRRAAASEAEPGVATAELHFGSLLAALAKQLLEWRSQDPNFKVTCTHTCLCPTLSV
jgi:hypothetical protein